MRWGEARVDGERLRGCRVTLRGHGAGPGRLAVRRGEQVLIRAGLTQSLYENRYSGASRCSMRLIMARWTMASLLLGNSS